MPTKLRIWVTGAKGCVGTAFQEAAPSYPMVEWVFLPHSELDITQKEEIQRLMALKTPAVVINTAALTNVDRAETDPAAAYTLNTLAPRLLAQACTAHNARLVHISTDYVFDGTATEPYKETHAVNPINRYGLSKYHGEQAVLQGPHWVVRTSWVYHQGARNFLSQLPRLLLEGTAPLTIESCQVNAPTYAPHLVQMIMALVLGNAPAGLYHACGSGYGTRLAFAQHIRQELLRQGKHPVEVVPMMQEGKTVMLQGGAPRPLFSAMDNALIQKYTSAPIPSWQEAITNEFLSFF